MANTSLYLKYTALLCILAVSNAYPTLWVAEDEATVNCLAHPAKEEGQHKYPVADTSSVIEVVNAAGQPVTAVCPGSEYSITVTFPQERRALLTTSQGSLAKAVDTACPGRTYTTRDGAPATSFKDTLTVPCNVTGPAVNIAVTSAAGKTATFNNLAAKLNIKPLSECPTSTCASGAARAAAANGTQALPAAAAAASPGAAAGAAPAAAAAPARSSAVAAAVPLGLAVAVLYAVSTVLGL